MRLRSQPTFSLSSIAVERSQGAYRRRAVFPLFSLPRRAYRIRPRTRQPMATNVLEFRTGPPTSIPGPALSEATLLFPGPSSPKAGWVEGRRRRPEPERGCYLLAATATCERTCGLPRARTSFARLRNVSPQSRSDQVWGARRTEPKPGPTLLFLRTIAVERSPGVCCRRAPFRFPASPARRAENAANPDTPMATNVLKLRRRRAQAP